MLLTFIFVAPTLAAFTDWDVSWSSIEKTLERQWQGSSLRRKLVGNSDAPRELACHSCTTIDASEIIGGAGVHPGVYLTSLLLSSIPVTSACRNPNPKAAAPICDDGLCVKINYTARATGREDVLRACLPRSRGVFKQVCTRFRSSQATGTWCVCGDSQCNSTPSTSQFGPLLVLLTTTVALLFAH